MSYYLWITDYANENAVEVETNQGTVRIEKPGKVFKLEDSVTALIESRDSFKQQAAMSMIIRKYKLNKLNESKTYWSISPHSNQQEMVAMVSKNSTDVKRRNIEVNATQH